MDVMKKSRLVCWSGCILLVCSSLHAEEPVPYQPHIPCVDQPVIQAARSKELADLVNADQVEREHFDELSEDEKMTLMTNDLIRRKRVGEILGEGCFQSAADYAAASLIYQHGDTPDHYYQAFVWANRAVGLGDDQQKGLVAMTIDRYLISLGHKQLFGTQAYGEEVDGYCYCLQPVEESFPDAKRLAYSGATLAQMYEGLAEMNEGKTNCVTTECAVHLNPSPMGTVPGFW